MPTAPWMVFIHLNVTTEIAGGGGFFIASNLPADIECLNPLAIVVPSRLCMPAIDFTFSFSFLNLCKIVPLTWRMKCVDNFDRFFKFNQLLLDLFSRRTIDNKHIDQIVGQQLARVANVNGSFCEWNIFWFRFENHKIGCVRLYPVYHR